MKKQNLFIRVALTLTALLSMQHVAFSQPCSNSVNLITNGNFSNGFAGFTSGMGQTSSTNCPLDSFGIGTAFDDFCNNFPTTPSGADMMVVDCGVTAPNTVILQQNISGVTAGITYTIGFRGACRFGNTPVPIDVEYNGTPIGSISINTASAFSNYSFNWTAPSGVASTGNVTFSLGGTSANNRFDFVVTDIEFSFCPSNAWRNTYQNNKDHNHFSVVELGEDFVVAGTLYNRGKLDNTTFGVRRFYNTGNIAWEQEYTLDNVTNARCFDIATSGTEDDALLALTGYVVSSGSNTPRPFVMILKADDGSIVNYKEFALNAFEQATGLDILYSATNGSYYIAGYQSNDILDLNSSKAGFVMCLDQSLNINWTKLITASASSSIRHMANNLTELPGTGVFVTGSVDNDLLGGWGVVSTLKMLLDYSGNTIWDLTTISSNSHECGVDAVYEAKGDLLYVMTNNSAAHSFEIQRIDNASSASANITITSSNNLLGVLGDVEGFSLAFDPNSDDLIVAGMIHSMPGATLNTPTFIAKVDINNFSVPSLHYIEALNAGYRDHDYDMFQTFNGQQAIINYPDILGVFPSNFVILGYEGLNAGYNLSVTYTDATGHTQSSGNCEMTTSSTVLNTFPARTGARAEEQEGYSEYLSAQVEKTAYDVYVDCEPLAFVGEKKTSGVVLASSLSDEFSIYPNPVSSRLQIEMPQSGQTMQVSMRLVDALGRVVLEHNGTYAPGSVAQLNISDLPEGVYYLTIQTETYNTQEPILIKRQITN